MIRILESIDTNSLEPKIQTVIDKITKPLADKVVITYIDKTLMPDELSLEFAWEHEPGNEEYLGTWEINMKDDINKDYIDNISTEIQSVYKAINNIEI